MARVSVSDDARSLARATFLRWASNVTGGPVVALLALSTAIVSLLAVTFSWGSAPTLFCGALTLAWFGLSVPVAFFQVWRVERQARVQAEGALTYTFPRILITVERITVNTENESVVANDPAVFVFAAVSNEGHDSAAHQWELWLDLGDRIIKGEEIQLNPGTEFKNEDSLYEGRKIDWFTRRVVEGSYHNKRYRLSMVTREPIVRGQIVKGFIAATFRDVSGIGLDAFSGLEVRCKDYRQEVYAARPVGIEARLGIVMSSADIRFPFEAIQSRKPEDQEDDGPR